MTIRKLTFDELNTYASHHFGTVFLKRAHNRIVFGEHSNPFDIEPWPEYTSWHLIDDSNWHWKYDSFFFVSQPKCDRNSLVKFPRIFITFRPLLSERCLQIHVQQVHIDGYQQIENFAIFRFVRQMNVAQFTKEIIENGRMTRNSWILERRLQIFPMQSPMFTVWCEQSITTKCFAYKSIIVWFVQTMSGAQ